MKPQPRTREQQKNNSPNPDFKSAANAPKILPKENRKPNNKNYAANDTLRTACKQVINELRVKKKGRGGFFLFFALFLACAKRSLWKTSFLKIVGAISDLNGRRIRSRIASNPLSRTLRIHLRILRIRVRMVRNLVVAWG